MGQSPCLKPLRAVSCVVISGEEEAPQTQSRGHSAQAVGHWGHTRVQHTPPSQALQEPSVGNDSAFGLDSGHTRRPPLVALCFAGHI